MFSSTVSAESEKIRPMPTEFLHSGRQLHGKIISFHAINAIARQTLSACGAEFRRYSSLSVGGLDGKAEARCTPPKDVEARLGCAKCKIHRKKGGHPASFSVRRLVLGELPRGAKIETIGILSE